MATDTWVELPAGSGGGGGGGVTSLNGLTGALAIASSTLNITPSGSVIDIEAQGNANAFAGFDNSGNLYSIPGFNIDTTSGGLNEELTEHPNNVVGGFTANTFNVAFEPLQNSPDDDWNIQLINVNFDNANSGFSQGTNGEAATILSLSVANPGTGPIGALSQLKMYYNMGNGTDPLTIKGLAYSFGFADVNDNVTIDGQFQGYDFQPHIHSGAIGTSNFNMYAFNDGAQVDIPVNSYNSMSLGPHILAINNNNNYNGVVVNPVIPTLSGNAGVTGYGFYPDVTTTGATGQVIGINMGPTIGTLGANANYQAVAVSGTITTMGSNSNLNGFSWFPNVTTSHGTINGIQISPNISGGDANFTGLQINPNGGATLTTVQGISINLNSVNTAEPQGPVGINSDSRLQVNASTQLKSAQTFQIGTRIEHEFTVPLGSPVTGTDELGLNLAGDFLVQDNVANGIIGIGFNSVGFIADMAVAATKTVDTITVFLPACALPDPGFTTGGNVTEFHMIREFAPLSQGGTINITNLYGFKIDSLFGDFGTSAANAWGLYLDTTANNYIASSMAFGTTTKKVTNSSVAIEIGGTTRAVVFTNVTTTQKNSLTALPGMQVFDTTLNQMSYYNGSTWINF